MLVTLLFALSILIGVKQDKIGVITGYWLLSFLFLIAFGREGVEAAYQISSKPSDTGLYFRGFSASFEQVSEFLFFQYPLSLKVIVYPFNNAYLAIVGQLSCVAILLLTILKRAPMVAIVLVMFNHTLLYTGVNLFKDNYFIVVCLLTVAVIEKTHSRALMMVFIALSIFALSQVRPFSLLFMPLAFIPFMFGSVHGVVKKTFWVVGIGAIATVLITKWSTIKYVALHWSSNESLGTSGFSIASIPKVFLGPTPFHYLFHNDHFYQPLLDSHALLLTFLHFIFYLALANFIFHFFRGFPLFAKAITSSIAGLYSIGVGSGILLVYLIAYGTADVRQRAIIWTLLLVGFFAATKQVSYNYKNDAPAIAGTLLLFIGLNLVSVIAI